ncbi:Metal-dependent hydrolase, endonuclease/exonuclease/phosphatase family [Tistlia consotensis]|uniref:Metal-dependent hydrolase, endonuclease/exonuclease/phosphatase family n=1 Tax=Tistlia consotensis USBA 355 TaxID=560819 RepID=A0A1Y6C044_9PROT|nr:endonuclease/exonuclease/phosphatase family protein [Tistlia consotensis]SMF38685.1 Metal-dependent hydrolase, endonuclease/exonuclease/phosphatase family [Tistlia consotensis USBA 355]SNR36916.1 Metal-dependent hydrolase, endonuclease/exonuclease/phosphatase family [Tistlia consotensis]
MTGRLRLATFNLENLDDSPRAAVPLAERLPVLRPQLARLEADLLCLQEINAPRHRGSRRLSALDRLLENGPYAGFYRAVSLSQSGHGAADRHNLAILSRWPIRRWHSLRHELVAPPELEGAPQHWDRPLLWAEVELPGGRSLTLVDLHLRAPRAVPEEGEGGSDWAPGFFRATVRRLGQALEARLLVERLLAADPEALVAVCGDCNAPLEDDTLRLLEGRADEDGAEVPALLRLIDLARALPEDRRYSLLHGGERLLLDHILASRPLYGLFRAVEIHNELLTEEEDAGPASGHAPLVAEFALP